MGVAGGQAAHGGPAGRRQHVKDHKELLLQQPAPLKNKDKCRGGVGGLLGLGG